MNKKSIALTVLISVIGSDSAIAAWEVHGTGNIVDFGGALTPTSNLIPWEVEVGGAITNLNSNIDYGDKTVNITASANMPILGIRTKTNNAFAGTAGITPQISYGSAINISEFEQSKVPLTLDVKNSSDVKIGELISSISASSLVSMKSNGNNSAYYVFSSTAGSGFYGGLPASKDKTANVDLAKEIMPEIANNYADQGLTVTGVAEATSFSDSNSTFSGYYASGIKSGENIRITLNSPVNNYSQLQWKASLPVTVSYQ